MKTYDNRVTTKPTEQSRQQVLQEYGILDTHPEKEFEALAELATILTGASKSQINFMDNDRQWTKAGVEVGKSISRTDSICQSTVLGDDNFEVKDLSKDDRFKNLFYVEGDPNYRFYSGTPLKSPCGHKLGALCVLDTKPRKLNLEQKKALETLASEIMVRLELRKQKLKLDQLNKEKDQFLRIVSHDIKSPITGVISATNYLQTAWEGDREELDRMLYIIELSSKKLLNYTTELISNSLFQNNSTLTINVDKVNIDNLVEDLIDTYAPLAKGKEVQLKISIHTSEFFSIDEEKFKLILSNVISNALKFSEAGDTVELMTEFKAQKDSPRILYCKVSDTGMGIPQEFLPTLFNGNKKHQRQGTQGEISTGLGLPIIKQFVDLHQGEIKIDSK
ncbi:MAG: GAF domain-containing sensor histidine kinase, partial [Balneolaceae bacterium]